ncbi:MAG: replicative DNA helicase [Clostridiales bacterium]|nr:replicative DNA helicase [Clostridiales bacterium]
MAYTDEREKFAKKHPNVQVRETPNSYEAEIALLGGIMLDAQTATDYIPQLSEDDFYTPANKYVFEAMNGLFLATKPIDFVTVVNTLESSGTIGLCGGVDYITRVASAVPSVANSEYYFNIVKKHTQLRALLNIANKMTEAAYSLDPDDNALTAAEAELYSLAENGKRGKPQLINTYINDALVDLKKRQSDRDAYRGVPSGFPKLDMLLGGGFQKSDLIILAARPGQGKTSFAMNCAVNAALARRPDNKKPYSVAVFSLEMSAVQLAKRILCSVGSFDMSKANRANIDDMGWTKLYGAQHRFENTSLYVDESGSGTPAEILSKCRALKHSQSGLDLVMIDYLQLMHSGKKIDNVVHEIAEITRSLKLAAKELDVPILLLSQMSRDIDKRKDPRPQLSDLRDSGAIEQDADIVFFLDRNAKATPVEDTADDGKSFVGGNTVFLNIAKHRNGETGDIRLVWIPSTVTFRCVDSMPGMSEPNKNFGRNKNSFYSDYGEEAPPPPDEAPTAEEMGLIDED